MSADDPQLMPRALGLMRRQRYDEALPLLQLAARLSPDAPRTVALLGVCLAEKNMLDPALVALRRAVTLDPNNPRAYYNLGTLLERAGKSEEARWTYERALALDPQYEAPQRALSQLPPPPAPVREAASAASSSEGPQRCVSQEYGLSLTLPPDWTILWQDEPAGPWTTAVAAEGRDVSGRRIGLTCNVRRGNLLREAPEASRGSSCSLQKPLTAPHIPGEYLERLREELPLAFSGFQVVAGEVIRLQQLPACRLLYTYERGVDRTQEACITGFGEDLTVELTFEAPADQFAAVTPQFREILESLCLPECAATAINPAA